MKIEFQFNSVQIDPQYLQEYCPNIISTVGSYSAMTKTPKRKKRKKGISVSDLINEIIDSVEEK